MFQVRSVLSAVLQAFLFVLWSREKRNTERDNSVLYKILGYVVEYSFIFFKI